MHLKEQELYQGVFDDHDISRMPEYQFASKVRLDLETAAEKYIKASSINKKPRSQINDEYALKSLLVKLEKVYVDEINLMKSRLFWESWNKKGNLKQLSEPIEGF